MLADVSASMRPQRNAAENRESVRLAGEHDHASMRPQRNAAENDWKDLYAGKRLMSFNEAAA